MATCFGNQLQQKLVASGLGHSPKVRKPRHKTFNCHKCGKPMTIVEGTNTMACECGQYFIFSTNQCSIRPYFWGYAKAMQKIFI